MKRTLAEVQALGDKAWTEFEAYADSKGMLEIIRMLPDEIQQVVKTAMTSGIRYGLKVADEEREWGTLQ